MRQLRIYLWTSASEQCFGKDNFNFISLLFHLAAQLDL